MIVIQILLTFFSYLNKYYRFCKENNPIFENFPKNKWELCDRVESDKNTNKPRH